MSFRDEGTNLLFQKAIEFIIHFIINNKDSSFSFIHVLHPQIILRNVTRGKVWKTTTAVTLDNRFSLFFVSVHNICLLGFFFFHFHFNLKF